MSCKKSKQIIKNVNKKLLKKVNNNNKPVVKEDAPNTMALGAVATGNIKAYEDVTAAKKVNKNIINKM